MRRFGVAVAAALLVPAISFGAFAAAKAAAGEQLWGVFIRAGTERDFGYVISWNYPDVESAVIAAHERCQQKFGMPCAPRRLLPNDVWFPDILLLFSTSGTSESGRMVVEDYAYESKYRCLLVYSYGSIQYATDFGNSEAELRRRFEKRSAEDMEYYVDAEPHRLDNIYCNDL